MKAPKPPKLPAVIPPPPPVSATATDVSAASRDAKQRDKKNYGFDKTIYRAGGMSTLPPGTSPTLGK
jgi:hypothetical protein